MPRPPSTGITAPVTYAAPGDASQTTAAATSSGDAYRCSGTCVLIADRGQGVGYFGMLSVSPALQAAGLGRRLVEAAHLAMQERYRAKRVRISVLPQRTEVVKTIELVKGSDATAPIVMAVTIEGR